MVVIFGLMILMAAVIGWLPVTGLHSCCSPCKTPEKSYRMIEYGAINRVYPIDKSPPGKQRMIQGNKDPSGRETPIIIGRNSSKLSTGPGADPPGR